MSRWYIVTCLFNLHAEYIMRNAGLEEAQAGVKIAGRNINNLRYADDNTLIYMNLSCELGNEIVIIMKPPETKFLKKSA